MDMSNAHTTETNHMAYRIVESSRRDGVRSVSADMTEREALDLAAMLAEANPAWLTFEVESSDAARRVIATFGGTA